MLGVPLEAIESVREAPDTAAIATATAAATAAATVAVSQQTRTEVLAPNADAKPQSE